MGALFCGKVSFPLIVMQTTRSPKLQASLLVLVSAAIFLVFVRVPPAVSHRASVLVQGSKCVTLYAMLCGLYTDYVGDKTSDTPFIALSCGSAFLMLTTILICL